MRTRITFSKSGPLKYIGHLDLATIWERAARRADLPLSYTHGFHPQPRINLASALPLGFSSRCEIVDIRLNQDIDLVDLPSRLQSVMPAGIGILSVERVDEQAPALQTELIAAEYEVQIIDGIDLTGLEGRLAGLLASPALPRERRGKTYDLRPLIEELQLHPSASPVRIFMRLAAREGATGRPEEVLGALGIPVDSVHIERTRLIFRD